MKGASCQYFVTNFLMVEQWCLWCIICILGLAIIPNFHYQDGWMTCNFTSFSKLFQSYQDNGRLIMKGCVQWSSVYDWEDFASSRDWTWSARSVGQGLTHWATRAPHYQDTITTGEIPITILLLSRTLYHNAPQYYHHLLNKSCSRRHFIFFTFTFLTK